MEVHWTDLAERDLGGISEYLFARSRSGTRGTIAGILAATAGLADHPEMGAQALDVDPEGQVRNIFWRRYRIFYRVRGDDVLVLRIWDSRRDLSGLVLERTASDDP